MNDIFENALQQAKQKAEDYENIVIPEANKVIRMFHEDGLTVGNARKVLQKLNLDIEGAARSAKV